MVQVTTRTSAVGRLPLFPLRAVVSGFGAKPLGHGISVNRESPVAVVNARNSRPSEASESKSIISRCRSSGVLTGFAAFAKEKVSAGTVVALGSKPRLRFIHARSTVIVFL